MGSLPLLAWLREERGCPWDGGAWLGAADGGCEAMLEWLHEAGCPKPVRVCWSPDGGMQEGPLLQHVVGDARVTYDFAVLLIGCGCRARRRWQRQCDVRRCTVMPALCEPCNVSSCTCDDVVCRQRQGW